MIRLFKTVPITIFIISLLSINPKIGIINTYGTWLLALLFYFLLIQTKYRLSPTINPKIIIWVNLYILWLLFSIFRGFFIAETYWDWKGLFNNSFGLLMPLAIYISLNKQLLQSILSFYFKYTLPLIVFIYPFVEIGALGFFIYAISFILLFTPVLPKKWGVLLVSIAVFVIVGDLSARAVLIKFVVAFIFSLLFYFRRVITSKILSFFSLAMFVTPILFFILAVTTDFNIFLIDQYTSRDFIIKKEVKQGKVEEENLLDDNRSGLYIEVIHSALKHNSWLIGRSPARGNETKFFAGLSLITGRKERLGNEVGVLNVFTWTGIIGVIFYLFMFFRSSFLAINHSNNYWSKIVGLYIAFRWIFFWSEDIPNFTLNNFILMLIVGLGYSSQFRKLSNNEVALWIKGIFIKPQNKKKEISYKVKNIRVYAIKQ